MTKALVRNDIASGNAPRTPVSIRTYRRANRMCLEIHAAGTYARATRMDWDPGNGGYPDEWAKRRD